MKHTQGRVVLASTMEKRWKHGGAHDAKRSRVEEDREEDGGREGENGSMVLRVGREMKRRTEKSTRDKGIKS